MSFTRILKTVLVILGIAVLAVVLYLQFADFNKHRPRILKNSDIHYQPFSKCRHALTWILETENSLLKQRCSFIELPRGKEELCFLNKSHSLHTRRIA